LSGRARAEIAKVSAQLHQVAVVPNVLVELQAVVCGRRIRDHREPSVRPVERWLDDDAADAVRCRR
jgi:hypothetical protein